MAGSVPDASRQSQPLQTLVQRSIKCKSFGLLMEEGLFSWQLLIVIEGERKAYDSVMGPTQVYHVTGEWP